MKKGKIDRKMKQSKDCNLELEISDFDWQNRFINVHIIHSNWLTDWLTDCLSSDWLSVYPFDHHQLYTLFLSSIFHNFIPSFFPPFPRPLPSFLRPYILSSFYLPFFLPLSFLPSIPLLSTFLSSILVLYFPSLLTSSHHRPHRSFQPFTLPFFVTRIFLTPFFFSLQFPLCCL